VEKTVAKKVIQVPVDEELLKELDRFCAGKRRSRSELIRRACQSYLDQVEREELDRRYQQGYAKVPEEPGVGESQAAISGEVLPGESW
jgi:metal-responsive CopG/Arc/MetJ family transcriptional regulator